MTGPRAHLDTQHPSLTRRQIFAQAGSAAMCSALPGISLAQPGTPPLHVAVAQRVRALAPSELTTLRLLIPAGSGGNVGPVAQTFHDMTGIRIHITETPYDEINTDLALGALVGEQSYDLALPATFGLPDLVAAGAILPLTDYARHHEPKGFRDGILFGVGDSFDDEIYGFQTDGDTYLMFYNTDFLNNATYQQDYAQRFGLALRMPDTWEELDRQMGFFHRPESGQYGGLLFRRPGYTAWEWWVRFHAKGLWPFDRDMVPQIDSAQGIAALTEMIAASRHQWSGVTEMNIFQSWERFSKGDVYCCIGWGGSQKLFNSATSQVRGKLAYGPTPGGIMDGKMLKTPYFNWGWNYVVARTSPVPEIAYLYALFASSPAMSTLAVRQTDGFFDPFRPEHYDDPGIIAAYSSAFLEVHRASMESAIPDIYLKDQGEYLRVLGAWLTRAFDGEVSPKDALTRTAQRWRLITNRAGRTQQIKRWDQLKRKYPSSIRRALRDLT